MINTSKTILIHGPSGTGKTVFAQLLSYVLAKNP